MPAARVIVARIRAQGAREAPRRLCAMPTTPQPLLCSFRMEAYGGPALPSPPIVQCLHGGRLRIKCHRCETEASIPLDPVRLRLRRRFGCSKPPCYALMAPAGRGTSPPNSDIRAACEARAQDSGKDDPMTAAHWKAFSPDSRTDQCARPGAAGHGHADHGSSRSRVRRTRPCRAGGHQAHFPHQAAGHHLSRRRAPAPGKPRSSTRCRRATRC